MKKLLIFLGALAAYGTDCTISDTVRTPFGGYFAGRIVVALNSPASAQPLYSGSQTLTGWQTTIEVPSTANGVVAFTLVCTDTITPSGTSYSARYQPTSGSGWAETWSPATGTTTIRAMRATTVPTPTTTFQSSQLALAAGSMVYGSSAGVGTALAAGTNGQVLALSGGYPAWTTNIAGNAGTATALAANGTNCAAGTFPLGVDASGAAESCTALPTTISGTANQITASASTGAVTLSLPSTVNTNYLTLNSPTGSGSTGSENLYKLRINMGTAPGYGLSIANGAIDPWFHVNSNGIGFVGDGTTIPFWSIEDEASFVRELRAHVVPAGSYSYLWAKSSDFSTKPNDLQLWGNRDIVLQAGRSNSATDNTGKVIIQGSGGTIFTAWGSSGSNNSRTTIDQVGGARFYQYNSSGSLTNLLQGGGFSYITGGRVGIGGSTDNSTDALQVTGSVSASGGFTGSLTGNASTATALASTVASGRLWIGQGTGVPTSSANLFWDISNNRLGIGTATAGYDLEVYRASSSNWRINVAGDAGQSLGVLMSPGSDRYGIYGNSSGLGVQLGSATIGTNTAIWIDKTSRNVAIGTTTDLGYGLHAANKATNGNLLVFDPTATSGVTTADFKSGAGQGTSYSLRFLDSSGAVVGGFRPQNSFLAFGGTSSAPGIRPNGQTLEVVRFDQTGSSNFAALGYMVASSGLIAYASSTDPTTTKDLSLSRASAGVVQVGDGGANSNGAILAKTHTWAAGTEGTCNSTNRGQVVMVQSGAGVADTLRVCRKDAADAYAWTALY